MPKIALTIYGSAAILVLLMPQNYAYSHGGYSLPAVDNPIFNALAPVLSWVGFLAFIGSMLFAVLVLVKNRARKIAC